MKKLVGVGIVCLFASASLVAQTAAISGVVTDPSGAVIPKAAVSVTNTQTGAKRSDVSDAQGRYSIPQLPPGTYSLNGQAAGFNEINIQQIELLVNSPATVNV